MIPLKNAHVLTFKNCSECIILLRAIVVGKVELPCLFVVVADFNVGILLTF